MKRKEHKRRKEAENNLVYFFIGNLFNISSIFAVLYLPLIS